MSGNPLQHVRIAGRVCALMALLSFLTGCGFKLAGPGESITVAALSTEDLKDSCTYDFNLPDQPTNVLGHDLSTNTPVPTEVAALVIFQRGDSDQLFNDEQVQNMAATLHMVTVYAHECDSQSHGDLQADATKGPGRALFAAISQYATDSRHPEIANLPVVMTGFSAAGVLTTTMANAYPQRILGFVPYASGSIYLDLDTVPVTAAAAKVPALVLANAYDAQSGVQRSQRYFYRGWNQGAPWGFGVQNHTGHCCTLSIRDVLVPWVTAVVGPLETGGTQPSSGAVAAPAAKVQTRPAAGAPVLPTVRFLCYTDGFYDSYYEYNCWIPSASILPQTDGGPQAGWLPDATSASAWLNWVTRTNSN